MRYMIFSWPDRAIQLDLFRNLRTLNTLRCLPCAKHQYFRMCTYPPPTNSLLSIPADQLHPLLYGVYRAD